MTQKFLCHFLHGLFIGDIHRTGISEQFGNLFLNNHKMHLHEVIGERIREFRFRSNVSQLALEMMIGASPGSISRIESGKVNPKKETLINIAHAMNLENHEIIYLFGFDKVYRE